jgi:gamma-glutamyltranspeptidase/glutathione hydrolase
MIGAVACGHPDTAWAATQVLEAGGNAFDAVVAAQFAACVAEPVLASLGGGGYLVAQTAGGESRVYDFFSQTPRTKCERDLDFYPIDADFGGITQEFHIGLGAVATPGMVGGAFRIIDDLATLPAGTLIAPAVDIARRGAEVTEMQAYIFTVVAPIYRATDSSKAAFEDLNGDLPLTGGHLHRPELADTFEALATEGADLFYKGEIASMITELCRQGGHLGRDDLAGYEVQVREPLIRTYREATVLSNPPPSCGGILNAFALELLSSVDISQFRHSGLPHLLVLAEIMDATNKARVEVTRDGLDPALLKRFRDEVQQVTASLRGTTHISVVDKDGNIAAMSLSNGEGCGTMVPNTGFMLNNMLGEEDINPAGFGNWMPDERMVSMMSPTVIDLNGARYALGSGGSNRIRSAVLQVTSNLVDHSMSLDGAIEALRIHNEGGVLSIEGGFDTDVVAGLKTNYVLQSWPSTNLFFGGVHAVSINSSEMNAHGDPRRGGVGVIV